MSKSKISVLCLPVLCLLAGLVVVPNRTSALPPPDNASSDSVAIQDYITAHMSNVDDVGLVIVWNGNGATTVGQCQWVSGQHGAMTVTLDQRVLNKGINYVTFVIYNKIYAGAGLFAGGKWSGDLTLKQNGTTVWSISKHVSENDKAIKYWKVFRLDVAADGSVRIVDEIPSEDLAALQQGMMQLERNLNNDMDVATPF
jgi:hypothetical protein